eukprot:scaffold10807_cov79-Phaeocystis_antarctica.AAC.6
MSVWYMCTASHGPTSDIGRVRHDTLHARHVANPLQGSMCVCARYTIQRPPNAKRQPVTAARRAARHLVVCAAPYMRRLGMCSR